MARAQKYGHHIAKFNNLWTVVTCYVAIILLLAPMSYATVINVPSDQPTIQAGINAAVDGDVVLVAPGMYRENLIIDGKELSLIGNEGSALVSLQPDDREIPAILFINTAKCEFSNFTVAGGDGIRLIHVYNSATVAITDCVFLGFQGVSGQYGWVIHVEGKATIYGNLFFSNRAAGCIGISTFGDDYGRAVVINNTFDGNNGGVHTVNYYGVIKNNIITNNSEYGISGNFEEVDYNCVWHNSVDYERGAIPGPHDISSDPLYTNPGSFDYTLQSISPCINTGDPDPQYNDPDGTPADIGAFPFLQPYPGVIWFNPHGEDMIHVVTHTPTFYWHYYDIDGTQTGYEIEMGTDTDWTTAELWATGEVMSSDTFIVYNGFQLEDGESVSVRVRVNNGTLWGEWLPFSFRMNSEPTIPGLMSPIGGEQANYRYILQRISNSSDDQNDSLLYQLEIYKDAGMTDLVFERQGIPEENTITRYRPMGEFEIGRKYWWRARAYDGFEFSDWSAAESFIASDGPYIRVPDDWSTIQGAIDAAPMGGVILVSPGEYEETILFPEKSIMLMSTSGWLETFIRLPESAVPPITLNNSKYSVLKGFTITGDANEYPSYVWLGNESLVEHCRFTQFSGSNDNAPAIQVQSHSYIKRNLFFENSGLACISVDSGASAHIINNTFDRNRSGVYSFSQSGVIENNIFVNSLTYGIKGEFDTCSYNCLWNNTYNIAIYDSIEAGPGPDDILADPLFMYRFSGDYRLLPESPCINAGDPGMQYADPDGTRNDMGALHFSLNYPIAVDFDFGSGPNVNITPLLVPLFSWSYIDTAVTDQTGYEIEVGTDNDWRYAEMWASGEVLSGNTYAVYTGNKLNDHTVYVLRIRLFNGTDWGDWITRSFRTCADSSGSNWSMHGGDAVHSGCNSKDRIKPPLELKWSRRLYDYSLNQISLANDKVLVSSCQMGASSGGLWCLNATNGELHWSREYSDDLRIYLSQPSYGYGLVYAQVRDSVTFVEAININTGYPFWRTYYPNQWYISLAPTLYDTLIMFCGFTYGGMHTLNALTGEFIWNKPLGAPFEPFQDGWTPAAYNGEVYIFLPGWLSVADAYTGETHWGVDLTPQKSFSEVTGPVMYHYGVPVIDTVSKLAYMAAGTGFNAVDIVARQVLWQRFGGFFSADPAALNGTVYINHSGVLKAFDGRTGDSLWSVTCPEQFLSGYENYDSTFLYPEYHPVIANGYLYISSATNIYSIDLATHEIVWSYPVSGYISIGSEQLYVASWNGFVYTFAMAPTDIDDDIEPIIPLEATLNQNYPNPFNASTRIDYSLPRAGVVTIIIYNILGETVRELVNEYKPAGEYIAIWNGKDDHNVTLASGIYIYRLVANNHAETKTMLLLK